VRDLGDGQDSGDTGGRGGGDVGVVAGLRTATFTRRVLSHEDPDAILAALRETAAEWLAADRVVVSAGQAPALVPAAGAGSLLVQEATAPQPVRLEAWSARPCAFGAAAHVDARVLVEVTAVALDAARKLRLFHDAVARRDTIGRAKGILSERYGVDDDRAFALLRRLSQERNRRLVDVAADVIVGRLLAGRSGSAGSAGARTPA
jgi:hypothetical protein